jgi:hypothetical protein
MNFDFQALSAVCLGIALSASCGFRVFIPLLAVSIAGYFQWLPLPADMQWLGSLTAIICFSVAAIAEISAYYIPFLDNLLDIIATPLAIAAGSMLAFAIFPIPVDNHLVRFVLGLVTGGVTAGVIQTGTSLLRLFTTKATIGAGNVLVASGENAAAVTVTFLSFLIPVMMAVVLLVLTGWLAFRTIRRLLTREKQVY